MLQKNINRKKRHFRIRKRIRGTSDVPRLTVSRSLANMYVQVIDDIAGITLIAASTASSVCKAKQAYGGNVKAAEVLAEVLAQKMKEKNITKIAFDRGGFFYHGRIKAFADMLRKQGIAF